jgi:hypothetical protein
MDLDDELPGLIEVVHFGGPPTADHYRKALDRLDAKIAAKTAGLQSLPTKGSGPAKSSEHEIREKERALASLRGRRRLFAMALENLLRGQAGEDLKGKP